MPASSITHTHTYYLFKHREQCARSSVHTLLALADEKNKRKKKRWRRKCKTESFNIASQNTSQKQFAELIFDWIYYIPVQFTQAPPSITQIIKVINGGFGQWLVARTQHEWTIYQVNMTLFPFIICWCCWFRNFTKNHNLFMYVLVHPEIDVSL